MVWGGLGHLLVVCIFPALGMQLRTFQDYDSLGKYFNQDRMDTTNSDFRHIRGCKRNCYNINFSI